MQELVLHRGINGRLMVHVDKKVYSKGFRVMILSITDDYKTAMGLFL
jgi:hypothetical protein